MAWLCGIDEAGYGPNLGPMVTTLVTVPLWNRSESIDLWNELKSIVRKADGSRDERIIVDDSKAVYSPAKGLGTLERSVLTLLDAAPARLRDLWDTHISTPWEEMEREPWHCGELELPQAFDGETSEGKSRLSKQLSAKQIGAFSFRCIVTFPRPFNAMTDRHDSKGAVTLWAVGKLLEQLPELCEQHRRGYFAMDKLGGRDYYQGLLRQCFFGMRLHCREEGEAASRYRIELKEGSWELTIEPKADSRHFVVALASMFSKYVRELLMHQFNTWWCARQPGLEPTAGYPNDAVRWWKDTAKLRKKLGVPDDDLWRRR